MGHENCATDGHSNFVYFNVLLLELVKQYDRRNSEWYTSDSSRLKVGSCNDVGSRLADIKKYATFVKQLFAESEITSWQVHKVNF